HPGEVLHQHAGRAKGDLAFGGLGLEPLRNRLDVLLGDRAAILVTQQILQQHLHGERQPRDTLEAVLLCGRQAVISVSLAAHLEGLAAAKTVEWRHRGRFPSNRERSGFYGMKLPEAPPPVPVASPARVDKWARDDGL